MTNVFLNVPFDDQYRDLFLALVTGVVGHGATPRSVLELPASQPRLARLKKLIKACPISFNDLSRVQSTFVQGHGRVPRFNMPFELGMAVMTRNRIFLLEEKAHRIAVSLNDINGFDTLIHGNRPALLLEGVRDALRSPSRAPTHAQLYRAYKKVRRAVHAHLYAAARSALWALDLQDHCIGRDPRVSARGASLDFVQ